MTQFGEIVSPTIKELFAERIVSLILSGGLKVGDKLPTERELGEQMHISKSIVHLGIKELERMGFLQVIPRQGTFVANYAEKGTFETLDVLLKYNGGRLSRHIVESIMDFRRLLEGDAMQKFALHCTADDIAALRDIVANVQQKAPAASDLDLMPMVNAIFLFHQYIFIHSGNAILPLVLNAFKNISDTFWKNSIRILGVQQSVDLLSYFTDCMARRDADEAVHYLNVGIDYYLEHTKSDRS